MNSYELDFRLADLLGCTIQELKERHTHREYTTRLAWMRERWNQPSRTDYYLMQIAQSLERFMEGFRSTNKSHRLEDFKIPFRFESDTKEQPQESKVLSDEEIKVKAEKSRADWFMLTGQLPDDLKGAK